MNGIHDANDKLDVDAGIDCLGFVVQCQFILGLSPGHLTRVFSTCRARKKGMAMPILQ